MNGVFEKNNSYPFTATPLGGWVNPDPQGRYVVRNIANEKFVKLSLNDVIYVDTAAEATAYSDAGTGAIAAGDILDTVKAKAAVAA